MTIWQSMTIWQTPQRSAILAGSRYPAAFFPIFFAVSGIVWHDFCRYISEHCCLTLTFY